MHEKAQRNYSINWLMNILSDEELELIDRYIAHDLDEADRDKVQNQIAEDLKWQEAHAFRLQIRETGRRMFHRVVREKFAALDQKRRHLAVKPLWLALAAGIALLISALLWVFPINDSSDLTAGYVKFPNIVLPIEKSGGTFTVRERAYQAYEMNEFAQSIGLFQSMEVLSTPDSIYLALSQLEANEPDTALELLNALESSQDTRWSQVAEWYKMWTLLKTGRRDESRIVLERIQATPDHRYQSNAEALLKEF
jgi:hypothetical protein